MSTDVSSNPYQYYNLNNPYKDVLVKPALNVPNISHRVCKLSKPLQEKESNWKNRDWKTLIKSSIYGANAIILKIRNYIVCVRAICLLYFKKDIKTSIVH